MWGVRISLGGIVNGPISRLRGKRGGIRRFSILTSYNPRSQQRDQGPAPHLEVGILFQPQYPLNRRSISN